LRGALFENLVVADIVKSRKNNGFLDNFFFYRDSNQNEADLIIDNLLKGLNYIQKILPSKIRHTYLCYAGMQEMPFQDHQLVNYRNISQHLIS